MCEIKLIIDFNDDIESSKAAEVRYGRQVLHFHVVESYKFDCVKKSMPNASPYQP